jgi:thymidylate synthase (FAD)
MRILYEPKVYLVGKTQIVEDGFNDFLKDNGLMWPTELDSPEGQRLVEMFGRNCYMSYGKKAGSPTNEKYLDNLLGFNRPGIAHGSVTEHLSYNFMVVGAGRGFTHEQVRHRAGWAYSQLSTRYCDFEREGEEGTWDPGFCVPPLAQLNEETKAYFEESLKESVLRYTKAYHLISRDIEEKFKEKLSTLSDRERRTFVRKAARGAARDLLPIGTEAILGMTGNMRTIWNTIVMRASEESEPQIRAVYVQIAKIMEKELPGIFKGVKYVPCWDGTTCVVMPRDKV